MPGDDAFERLRPRDDDGDGDGDGDGGGDDATATAPSARAGARTGRALVARWRVDARFGRKAAARDALKLWARTIGAEAGVSSDRFSVCSGYIGGRESALELRVDGFGTLGEVEAFLSGVPRERHVAWGDAFAENIVDGTPEWVIMDVSGVGESVGGGAGGGGGGGGGGGARADAEEKVRRRRRERARAGNDASGRTRGRGRLEGGPDGFEPGR